MTTTTPPTVEVSTVYYSDMTHEDGLPFQKPEGDMRDALEAAGFTIGGSFAGTCFITGERDAQFYIEADLATVLPVVEAAQDATGARWSVRLDRD